MARNDGVKMESYEHVTVSVNSTGSLLSALSTAVFGGTTSPLKGQGMARRVARVSTDQDITIQWNGVHNPAIALTSADGVYEMLDLTLTDVFLKADSTTANVTITLFY